MQRPRGLATTKPGSLLTSQIPVRMYTPWDEQAPGCMEIDLVAHLLQWTVEILSRLRSARPFRGVLDPALPPARCSRPGQTPAQRQRADCQLLLTNQLYPLQGLKVVFVRSLVRR
jgi:hypothetical protein